MVAADPKREELPESDCVGEAVEADATAVVLFEAEFEEVVGK